MSAKSPTTSVKSREIIGGDEFSQRREVFEKHDTVFLPLPSPTTPVISYKEVEPIITSNHGKTTTNFKRNTSGYSSMRETRSEDRPYFEFRARKYSDNFTSELNQSDDVDYRYSTAERTRRLSKMRRDFLNSNLHEPNESPFTRTGVRASMPTNTATVTRYKIESPKIHKFPFAEPYTTPTPVRRIIVDLGPVDNDGSEEKENQSPELRSRHSSLPNEQTSPKVDRQKLFEELVKRYSPQRKPIDWTLPPTKPKVVGSVPKSTSSGGGSIDNTDATDKDEVFEKKEDESGKPSNTEETKPHIEVLHNGPEKLVEGKKENQKNDSKSTLAESEENDYVPELSQVKRQLSRESAKRPPKETDLSIPALIDKMTKEGESLEHSKTNGKKVKRKRSFLDKLLGRKKEVKTNK